MEAPLLLWNSSTSGGIGIANNSLPKDFKLFTRVLQNAASSTSKVKALKENTDSATTGVESKLRRKSISEAAVMKEHNDNLVATEVGLMKASNPGCKHSVEPTATMCGEKKSQSIPDLRLLYRSWRTGSHVGADLGSSPSTETLSPGKLSTESGVTSYDDSYSYYTDIGLTLEDIELPSNQSNLRILSSPVSEPGSVTGGESTLLGGIPERLENERSLLLSNVTIDHEKHLQELSAKFRNQSTHSKLTNTTSSSSFERYTRNGPRSPRGTINNRKSQSYTGLSELEKYFPSMPKPSAQGVQRGLQDSVMNDMCGAVAKQMVGDIYVCATRNPKTKVINHLYEPMLRSVQKHFRRLPSRYALSVNPNDVSLHMRLLAKHERKEEELSLHAYWREDCKDTCEVVIVAQDQSNLLDAITRALTSLRGNIIDADVMTTADGATLDRFVVRGNMVSADRQELLKKLILENLQRSMTLNAFEQSVDTSRGGSSSTVETPRSSLYNQRLLGETAAATSENAHSMDEGVQELIRNHQIHPEWILNMNEIHLQSAIGTGRSGHTYLADWRATSVAAKMVSMASAPTQQRDRVPEEILDEFFREVALVSRLRHPNIVLFLGAAVNPPNYCLVYEYMQQGSLTDLIRGKRVPLDFFRLSTEIAKGMNYLHLCSIIHRDLKSGNILVDHHGTAKVSDFGLSCVFDVQQGSDLTAETGTYRWMAPEVIRHEPYSSKADVYSFGIVLWEMIAKEQPFRGISPIQAAFAVARQQMRPALPSYTPPQLAELVELCWHEDPVERPTFHEILEMLPKIQRSFRKRDYSQLGFYLARE